MMLLRPTEIAGAGSRWQPSVDVEPDALDAGGAWNAPTRRLEELRQIAENRYGSAGMGREHRLPN